MAQRDMDIDFARSWVIGDRTADIELANRIGAKILFLTLKFSLALITQVCSSQSLWFLFFHSVSYLGLLGFVFPFAEQSDSSYVSCLKLTQGTYH